jgi:hypothetical protein
MSEFKWQIEEVKQIVDDFQAKKINGVIVDVQSANRIVQFFDVFDEANKKFAQSQSIDKFVKFIWDVR